ncbi:MAG: hypothetical protein K6F57_02450 [Candidatus Saccharibacteria bacterium]|nr:hypothetical protein [Candidatus Saccharibacteria bacterium]
MFPFYIPWHPERYGAMMRHARTDLFMLDVQLGSACNGKCPRCDSSCSGINEPAALDIEAVSSLAAEISRRHRALGIEKMPGAENMGFCCGLGEPTFGPNLTKLKALIAATVPYGFSWSLFSNGIYWDDDLERYLQDGSLNVLVQYNSNHPEVVAKMLGVGPQLAALHMKNRQHLLEIASNANRGDFTNIGASIVPERDNYDEIMDIMEQCFKYAAFPLIGELENAGYSKGAYYERHKLADDELARLLHDIERRFGICYEVPFCPAAIGAIHINNHNEVTVDRFTGLSCGWFGMGDPQPMIIGDIRKMAYSEIVQAILQYRARRIPEVRQAIKGYPNMVFGGCGGNAQDLLREYTAIY